MRRFRLAPLCFAALLLGAAKSEKPPQPPPAVELKPIAMPVVVGGKLVNYLFVTVRITLAPGADNLKAQAKEPQLRDALVREASRHPFNVAGSSQALDEARLKAATLAAARAIIGPQARSVEVPSAKPEHAYSAPVATGGG